MELQDRCADRDDGGSGRRTGPDAAGLALRDSPVWGLVRARGSHRRRPAVCFRRLCKLRASCGNSPAFLLRGGGTLENLPRTRCSQLPASDSGRMQSRSWCSSPTNLRPVVRRESEPSTAPSQRWTRTASRSPHLTTHPPPLGRPARRGVASGRNWRPHGRFGGDFRDAHEACRRSRRRGPYALRRGRCPGTSNVWCPASARFRAPVRSAGCRTASALMPRPGERESRGRCRARLAALRSNCGALPTAHLRRKASSNARSSAPETETVADVREQNLYAVLGVSRAVPARNCERRTANSFEPRIPTPARTIRWPKCGSASSLRPTKLSNPRSRAVYDAERADHEDALVRLEPDRVDVLLRAGHSVTRRVSVVGGMTDITAAVTTGPWWRVRMPTTMTDRAIDVTLAAPPDADGELHATVHLSCEFGRLELPLRARSCQGDASCSVLSHEMRAVAAAPGEPR